MIRTRVFVLLFIIFVAGFLAHAVYLQKTVYGDGVYYFSWLRSIVIDRDIMFDNEYKHFDVTARETPLGLPGNKHAVGPALVWSPLYITAHTVVRGDGYSFPYQLAVGITNVLLVLCGLVLLYRLLPGSDTVKTLTTLVIALSTNLYFYGSVDPANSHGISFFACVLLLSFLHEKHISWLSVGVALGLLGITRPQDLLLGLLLVPNTRRVKIIPLSVGFSVFALPQLAAWHTLYGSIFTNPYILAGEGFALLQPNVLGVLFHRDSGLALWTPIVPIAFAGLIAGRKKYWNFFGICILQLYIVSTWSTWWQGASFSGRMFVSILPLAAFGLTGIMTKLFQTAGSSISYLLVANLGMLNMIAIIYFLLTH